jgi:HAD superfamily hydrolase (TIGR01549 family)
VLILLTCHAEVGSEKPNPVIFEAACKALSLAPQEVVHVGDDRRCLARECRLDL